MLGVVVNRVHSDKDQGYYGYSSGYGYGYGYGYGRDHYGEDSDGTQAADGIEAPEAQLAAAAAEESSPDTLSGAGPWADAETKTRSGIVPRRAA